MTTYATSFAEREFQVCVVSHLVEDGRTYWVAAGGGPMYAVLLAQRVHAPNAVYVTEDGIIAALPKLPLDPLMSVVSSRPAYRALMWTGMNTIGDHCSVGYMDYGILNTLQIDPYGNINSTWLGSYLVNGRRVTGPGGADSIAAMCWRTILMLDHQRRKFVPRVDFISSAGYLDGAPGARERVGLPRDTGPWRVVTNWAVFDFEEKTRHMRLIAVAPFVTVEQVLEEMSFEPLMADSIEVLEPPTEEELAILRTELDVRGQFMDASPRWVERRGEEWLLIAKEEAARERPAWI
ncbi:MAG: CoA-transferase subunit beta [Dehalococcoidia bacterium]